MYSEVIVVVKCSSENYRFLATFYVMLFNSHGPCYFRVTGRTGRQLNVLMDLTI